MPYFDYINYNYIKSFIDNKNVDILIYRLLTEVDVNTIVFILKLFFKNNHNIVFFKEWENFFNEEFGIIIKENLWQSMIISKDVLIDFYDFVDLKDLIKYLSAIENE